MYFNILTGQKLFSAVINKFVVGTNEKRSQVVGEAVVCLPRVMINSNRISIVVHTRTV